MEMVHGAPDRVNIPCFMHDTHLCQLDVKMTNNKLRYKYKTCHDVKNRRTLHNYICQVKRPDTRSLILIIGCLKLNFNFSNQNEY